MNQYVGKICPYCKATIKPSDDIVVCSTCDMPHHKECWIANRGCTTFGCSGTINTPKWIDVGTQDDDFEIILYDEFPAAEQYSSCYFSSYQESDMEVLIGLNVSYYLTKFNDMLLRGRKTSWNWCAFLIAPYWMIYRKMYSYGAGVLGILLILSLLGGVLAPLFQTVVYVLIGIYGNYIYMDVVNKKIAQMMPLVGQYRNEFIAKNSGTNLAGAILSALGYVLFVAII